MLLRPVMRLARRYALTLTRNRDDADDLLQDALMVAWVKFGQLSDASKYRGWLFAIIRREHWLRTRKVVRRTAMLQVVEYDEERNTAAALRETSRSRPGERMDLGAMLSGLGADDREMLLLATLAGVTTRELSALENCRLDCMKKRLERVRGRARSLIGSREGAAVPTGNLDPVAETMALVDAMHVKIMRAKAA